MHRLRFLLVCFLLLTCPTAYSQNNILVFQSDFGLKDGAVSAMKGVAVSVSANLKIFDLTHEIPAYNIWEAAYRLNQTVSYWPSGTVFVSVVDPGVGSSRRSVVMKTKTGHFIVTPDNGTLTLVAGTLGIAEVREIDESRNRLTNSNESYTFHGRDVYAFTGARLASGAISFKDVGKALGDEIIRLSYQKATAGKNSVAGTIDVLDIQYGNLWTNIPQSLLAKINLAYGDTVGVEIFMKEKPVWKGRVLFGRTFSAVTEGEPVAYLNSLLNFSIALNMGSFAEKFRIGSGPDWKIVISKQ
jgi:hypothetical protein